MPNKTINDITKTFLEVVPVINKFDNGTETILKVYFECALLSLLDEVEKRLSNQKTTIDGSSVEEDAECCGYNNYRQQVIKILSDIRGGK